MTHFPSLKGARSLISDLVKRMLGYNRFLDETVHSLEEQALGNEVEHVVLDLNSNQFRRWLAEAGFSKKDRNFRQKKALEFFFSSSILSPGEEDAVLDAAGGRSLYLDAVRNLYGSRRLYLQDQIYQGREVGEGGLTFVGGDAANIPLPDGSITRLACHHAFEHFQGDTDIRFIREVSRLLGTEGKACLIPLFLADQYVECWNIPCDTRFDENARLIVDISATLPGGDEDGHFCRIYDLQALEDRVVKTALGCGLEIRIVTCRLGGRDIPDLKRDLGSRLNHPLRALVLEKGKR